MGHVTYERLDRILYRNHFNNSEGSKTIIVWCRRKLGCKHKYEMKSLYRNQILWFCHKCETAITDDEHTSLERDEKLKRIL